MSQTAESATVAAGCPGTVLVSHDIWFPKGQTPCTQNISMYPGKAKHPFFVIFIPNCKTHEWMNFDGWGFSFLYLASFSLNTGCNDCSQNGDEKTNANSLKKWNASGIFCIAAHKWHEDLIVDRYEQQDENYIHHRYRCSWNYESPKSPIHSQGFLSSKVDNLEKHSIDENCSCKYGY